MGKALLAPAATFSERPNLLGQCVTFGQPREAEIKSADELAQYSNRPAASAL
jgi:hypothetical protein